MYKGDPCNVFQTSKGINVSVEKIEKFCTISQNFRNINIIYSINYYYVISIIVKCFYILAGVAVGGGWQALVAYINLFCYYIMGLPLGFLLGYKLGYRVEVKYTIITQTKTNQKISILFSFSLGVKGICHPAEISSISLE